jgi:hypothetical protein
VRSAKFSALRIAAKRDTQNRIIKLITFINELIGNWIIGPRAARFEQQLQQIHKVKFVQTTTTACHSF